MVAVFIIVLMLAISTLRTNWRDARAWLDRAGWWMAPRLDEASGD